MDPNEALRQIRRALKRWDELGGRGPEWTAERLAVAVELADHAEALDEWLSRGGFLPDAWMRREQDDQERELPGRGVPSGLDAL